MSYHVHITYMLTNKDQIKRAGELREEALVVFADLLGEDPVCRGTSNDPSGRYDNGELCMIYDHELDVTLGPFPVGEWSMFVPVHYYNRVVPWYVQHRGEFSLLVHPNTGCEYEDHSIWAQWSGDKWNLDMSIFTPHTQTESFNQTLGTPENPSCQPEAKFAPLETMTPLGLLLKSCAARACPAHAEAKKECVTVSKRTAKKNSMTSDVEILERHVSQYMSLWV
eukprot:CAMPEP_0185019944 /NCGR_PEP_ID=MMETSP1103-20130426/2538_1 /TAXON_ID=36769 /ORGANISM="Paraphysomonas bandaiensis, Strain Caron Lab Isolate" /LENGTH=223 /DNA_ID=CAMNT_0027550529 /DNA_START=194 /DNA_END=867 /DNA_ORIENTATION=-